MIKLHWTREALRRLAEIEDFIANDNPSAAVKFTNAFILKAESLRKYPERGRVVPEFNRQSIREIIFHSYRLVYRIETASIVILTLFESHRLMKEREVFQPLED